MLGWCWLPFVVLSPLGVINIGAMLVVAALVFAEKTLPRCETVARIAAVVVMLYGFLAMALPDALPTMT